MSKTPTRQQLHFVIDETCIGPLQKVSEDEGLGSLNRAARAVLQSALQGDPMTTAVDRETRKQLIQEYRIFLVTRISASLEELRSELMQQLDESIARGGR